MSNLSTPPSDQRLATQGYVYSFMLNNGTARGKIVRLGEEFTTFSQPYAHLPFITHIMADLALFGASLIPDFKSKATVTLQITGCQHISLIVVEITHTGAIRACAKCNESAVLDLCSTLPQDQWFSTLLSGGQFVLTTQFDYQHEMQQAIIAIEGQNLSESLMRYFDQSVQIPTVMVSTTSSLPKTQSENEPIKTDEIAKENDAQDLTLQANHVVDLKTGLPHHQREAFSAAALILQKLPLPSSATSLDEDTHESDWNTCHILLQTVTAKELLSANLSCDQLLHRLFNEFEIHVFAPHPLRFECTCSRPQLIKLLSQFPTNDLQDMSIDDNVEISCDYCKQQYIIHLNELTTTTAQDENETLVESKNTDNAED